MIYSDSIATGIHPALPNGSPGHIDKSYCLGFCDINIDHIERRVWIYLNLRARLTKQQTYNLAEAELPIQIPLLDAVIIVCIAL